MIIQSSGDLQILKNVLNMMPKIYRKRYTNKQLVQYILLSGTDHSGSTTATIKCHEINIKPDAHYFPKEQDKIS